MELLVSIKINSELKNIPFLTEKAKKVLFHIYDNIDFLQEIDLSLTEAITNIIEHSYKLVQTGEIWVYIYISKNNILKFELVDHASPYQIPLDNNIELNYDPEDIDSLPEGGMGLFLIHQCMDKVEFLSLSNKQVLTMFKKLPEINL